MVQVTARGAGAKQKQPYHNPATWVLARALVSAAQLYMKANNTREYSNKIMDNDSRLIYNHESYPHSHAPP